jgi:hypothetical protein
MEHGSHSLAASAREGDAGNLHSHLVDVFAAPYRSRHLKR